MSQPTRTCPTCHTPLPGVAAFCYVCGTATPVGMNRETGERIAVTRSGVGPVELTRKLQRALGPGLELQDRIGAGGFAEVFRARDLRLKRDLAIKVLRPDLGLSPELLQRFRREAETVANLRHPNIVPVYDIGEGEGLAYIIMPLIVGESLRAILDRDGAMPVAEVRRILRECTSGLAAAHDAGVIHRDIKPENVMLEGKDKRVLLMDFGIAKAVGAATGEDGDPAEALTTTGIIIGTPQYMSPEQACGDKSIDARTDQYSLAVVGYRMLSGKLPFEGESTRAVLYQQLVAEAQPLITKMADIPGPLSAAIQRAMAKEPAERFPSMREFGAMLEADSSLMPPSTTATAPAAATRAPAGSRRGLLIGAGTLAAAAIAWFALRPDGAASGTNVTVDSGPVAVAPESTPTAALAPPPAAAPAGAKGSIPPAPPRGGKAPAGTPLATAATPGKAPETAAPRAGCARAVEAADWTTAASACSAEAESGNATAQRLLGVMYDRGQGVAENPATAVSWFRKAAATDVEAKMLLARMLEIGRGTARSDGESIALVREAAASGLLRAQNLLAFRLENGSGIKKDEAEAGLWYRRAAERGDLTAQEKLAEYLARGRGMPKNEAEALEWYRKAGDRGSGEAAWQASQMYFRGRGTAKDDAAGMEWLRKAAAKNHAEAVKELKKRSG